MQNGEGVFLYIKQGSGTWSSASEDPIAFGDTRGYEAAACLFS